MAGIFPQGGIAGNGAINAIPNLTSGDDGDLVAGCSALFYGNRCREVFDPAQQNAIISELENILRDRGVQYDCSRLDNISQAIGPHVISYEKAVPLPEDPYMVLNGPDRTVVQGSFRVPNSHNRTIYCLAIAQLPLLVRETSNGENLDVDLMLSNDNSYTGRLLYATINLRNIGTSGTSYFGIQTTKTNVIPIPAGGRTFFYRLATAASAADAWQLKEDYDGCKWKFYGVSHTSSDIVSE